MDKVSIVKHWSRCPESLCKFCPWRFQKLIYLWGWPCSDGRVGPDVFHGCSPTWITLSSCVKTGSLGTCLSMQQPGQLSTALVWGGFQYPSRPKQVLWWSSSVQGWEGRSPGTATTRTSCGPRWHLFCLPCLQHDLSVFFEMFLVLQGQIQQQSSSNCCYNFISGHCHNPLVPKDDTSHTHASPQVNLHVSVFWEIPALKCTRKLLGLVPYRTVMILRTYIKPVNTFS